MHIFPFSCLYSVYILTNKAQPPMPTNTTITVRTTDTERAAFRRLVDRLNAAGPAAAPPPDHPVESAARLRAQPARTPISWRPIRPSSRSYHEMNNQLRPDRHQHESARPRLPPRIAHHDAGRDQLIYELTGGCFAHSGINTSRGESRRREGHAPSTRGATPPRLANRPAETVIWLSRLPMNFWRTYRKRAHLTDPIKTTLPDRRERTDADRDLGAISDGRRIRPSRRPQAVFKVVSKLSGGASIQKALDLHQPRSVSWTWRWRTPITSATTPDIAALVEQWGATFSAPARTAWTRCI